MKHCKHVALFLGVLLVTGLNPLFAQLASIFEASPLDSNSLTVSQLTKYQKVSRGQFYSDPTLVNVASLTEVQDSGRIGISLPYFTCNNMVFTARDVDYTDDENYFWYGDIQVEDDDYCHSGTLTLMARNGEKFGQLVIDTTVFEYHDIGDGLQVLALLTKDGKDCGYVPKYLQEEEFEGNSTASTFGAPCGVACEVSVYVFYTQAALNAEVSIPNRITLSIALTNRAFRNSRVLTNIKLVLSGSSMVPDFTETQYIEVDINRFHQSPYVQSERNATKSDLAVLLTNGPYGNIGGLVEDIGPDPLKAYAIVQSVIASDFVFAHEVGHLFGCRHHNDATGTIEHARVFLDGWVPVRPHQTILGSATFGKRILHYSNPDVRYIRTITGVSGHRDNAGKINLEGCRVANFYANPPVPLSAGITGYYTACACDNVYYSVSADCGSLPYSYQWEASYDGIDYLPVGNSSTYSQYMFCTAFPFTFFVRVTVTDAAGSSITLSRSTLILPTWSVRTCDELPGTNSANNTLQNQKSDDDAADNTNELQLSIYPQPARSEVKILVNSTKQNEVTVLILDGKGAVVKRYQKSIKGQDILHAQVGDLPSGTYFVVASSPGVSATEKLLIVK